MKLRALLLIVIAAFTFTVSAEAQSLPRKVRNVEVQDLDTNKARHHARLEGEVLYGIEHRYSRLDG